MWNGGEVMVTGHVEMTTKPNVTEIRLFVASSMMVQNGYFEFSKHMPQPERMPGVMNVLVLPGNNVQYASRTIAAFFEFLVDTCKCWDHVFFVPGPWEYCVGTLEKGDDFTSLLAAFSSTRPRTIVILGSNPKTTVQSVLFRGFGLLITGAECWPVDTDVYDVRRIYSRGDKYEKDEDAVANASMPTEEAMKHRLATDVASIRMSLMRCPDVPVRVVVTHGCPSSVLCTDERKADTSADFYGIAEVALQKLGFLDIVDYWIYGANGDRPVAQLRKKGHPLATNRNPYFVCNQFVPREGKFQWSEHIKVQRRTTEEKK